MPKTETGSITIGMNNRLFPSNWRPILDDIVFARDAGFASIQFHGSLEGLDDAQLGAPAAMVGAALRDSGIGAVMEIITRVDANAHTAHGRPLEVLEANLPAITALGCSHVHWHPVQATRMAPDALRELEARLRPQFAAALELGQRYGFYFGFEHNEPATGLFSAPEYCAAALDAVPGLGLVWDVNHTPDEQLAGYLALTARMTMLHVADTPLPDVNHHLPIGLGAIDFAAYFRELLARGFDGPAILEIGGLPRSGGYGRDTNEALIDSRARLLAALDLASQSPPA